MNDFDENQIIRAERIHASIQKHIPAELRQSSKIILKRPSRFPEPRKLSFPPQSETDKRAQAELLAWYSQRQKREHAGILGIEEIPKWSAASDLVEWGFPYYHFTDDFEWMMRASERSEQNEQWIDSPHHDLLSQLIASGKIPDDRGGDVSNWPRKLDRAWSRASQHGHAIPQKFYDGKEPSDGEAEAFYAARSLFDSGFIDQSNLQTYGTRLSVRSLVSNFPVPHPSRRGSVPFLIDQLWVILQREPSVRLLAIEVDGSQHLETKKQEHDAERDEILTRLGYEVWRVAAWWCRVDAWRVIQTVMAEANLLPYGESWLGDTCLTNIDSYVCDICGKPMVRYDQHWIQQWNEPDSDSLLKAHECCHPTP